MHKSQAFSMVVFTAVASVGTVSYSAATPSTVQAPFRTHAHGTTNPFVVRKPLRELTEADFTTLTASDMAMLEFAVDAGSGDDLDYSAFYIDD